jgi:CRP-like cAMP-binding protein
MSHTPPHSLSSSVNGPLEHGEGARVATNNRILAALATDSPADFAWLALQLEPVELAQGAVIAPANETLTWVYFPLTSVASVISRMSSGSAEVGTIGNEGLVGLDVLLQGQPSPNETVAQIPGRALRVSAAALADGTEQRPALRRMVSRYAHAYLTQVAQTASCNALHGIEQRCARWLLMTHDRVGGADQFPLTQEYLAIMLGVRRAGVSEAAGALQDAGLIRYRRGGIQILDRAGLEAAVCECYGIVRRHFDHLRPAGEGSLSDTPPARTVA